MVGTRGNIIVENIKIEDIIYEFDMGLMIKSEVISLPVRNEDGYWTWECTSCKSGKIIKYGVHEEYPHYAPKIYDFKAYMGFELDD